MLIEKTFGKASRRQSTEAVDCYRRAADHALIVRELSALYAAFVAGGNDPLPPLAIQPTAYATRQLAAYYDKPLIAENFSAPEALDPTTVDASDFAVTLGGGFTERAVTDRVKVIRTEGDREQVLEIGDAAAFEALARRGDIVVVSAVRPEVCYVTGEVKNAGAYRCERDTNVLKAVALAGGFTDAAAKGKIRIVRRVDGQEQVRERVSLEEPVLPDDILVVPKSFF